MYVIVKGYLLMRGCKNPDQQILYIVVPCYNEEETLPVTSLVLLDKLNLLSDRKLISSNSRILFVDDGSKDNTWDIISQIHTSNPHFLGIRLAHNRGHQNALLAGLMFAKDRSDFTITIDADLQQDIQAMDVFIEQYHQGCDIVYGIRNNRKSDHFIKKITALFYYKFMKMLGCTLYKNAADYRLMSKQSLEALSEYNEVNLFLRGLIPEIGFQTGVVYFDVKEREQGESKYTLSKMIKLAADGITSFSTRPIRYVLFLGIIVFLVSIVMIIVTLVDYYNGNTIPGWATLNCSVWFLGGIQLFAIGIVGEYIGKNYEETKRRPRYFLKNILDDEDLENQK